jgi:hypothetical protein
MHWVLLTRTTLTMSKVLGKIAVRPRLWPQ